MTDDYELEILRDENDELAETIHNLLQSLFDAESKIEELNKRLAEVTPKKGEWKVDQSHFSPHIICSNCGIEIPCVAGWCMDSHPLRMNYCPNCGAKMGSERNSHD